MLRSFKSCDSTTINSMGPRESSSATWFPYRKFQWVGTLSPVPFHPHLAPRSCTWRARISCKIFSRVAFLHPFSVWRCCRSWTCTGIASTSLFLWTQGSSDSLPLFQSVLRFHPHRHGRYGQSDVCLLGQKPVVWICSRRVWTTFQIERFVLGSQ